MNGGNPGSSDATTFDGNDIISYAMGPNPSIKTVTENGQLSLDYTRNLSADDIIYTVEVSKDMIFWQIGNSFTRTIDQQPPSPNGTSLILVRSLIPLADEPRQYLRLRVSLR
mgnify:FL=1